MSDEVIASSKTVKARPARTKSTFQFVDATPMIKKVDNELLEYRQNKYNKQNRHHVNQFDAEVSTGRKRDSDAQLDAEVQQLLRMNDLDKLKSYSSAVNTYGASGLHSRNHKQLMVDSLVAKGARRPAQPNIPHHVLTGMRAKNIEREAAKAQRQRDVGIFDKTGKNKRSRPDDANKSTSIDNGLRMKFGRVDKSGILSVRDNELSAVSNEGKQRMNGLKQTFKRTSTSKRKR